MKYTVSLEYGTVIRFEVASAPVVKGPRSVAAGDCTMSFDNNIRSIVDEHGVVVWGDAPVSVPPTEIPPAPVA